MEDDRRIVAPERVTRSPHRGGPIAGTKRGSRILDGNGPQSGRWTGAVTGDLVLAPLDVPFRDGLKRMEETIEAGKQKWSDKLHGKIVLTSTPKTPQPPTKPLFKRYTDAELADLASAPEPTAKMAVTDLKWPEDPEEMMKFYMIQDEVRDTRLQRQGEPRRRCHVADLLRAEGTDLRRRDANRRAREEGGELRITRLFQATVVELFEAFSIGNTPKAIRSNSFTNASRARASCARACTTGSTSSVCSVIFTGVRPGR